MYDVVIIGAGVVGAMTARVLSRYDLTVCLVERHNDVAMGATKANSAIVHAGFDAECGSLKARLNVRGSQMMKRLTDELGVKYKNNGSLVVGFDDEDRKIIDALYERGAENGVEGLEVIDSEKLHSIEKNISPDAKCALYAPTGAIVCPYELTIAAVGNAMDNGVQLELGFEVKGITYIDSVYHIASDDKTLCAKYVVNAAGIYADKIAQLIGDDSFTIHPCCGEYILLDKECGDVVSHTIFRTPNKLGKGILITPTVDSNLLAGPTATSIEDKENTATTTDGLEQIITQSMQTVPNIHFNQSITSFCGLRAKGSTGDFIINSPRHGFINAAGIESPGLSAAPAIAEYVRELLEEAGLTMRKRSDYNPYRRPMHFFRDATLEEKNEIIKSDCAYGRVICRCETVTEGEILYAMRQNPKPVDLDGVKRRTRAQMGRCQGGFCSPYIVGIISKELGIPYEAVTKSGGKSFVNISRIKEADAK